MLAAMSAIQAVSGANAGSSAVSGLGVAAGTPTLSSPFADLISDAVGNVNQLEAQAQSTVSGLMTGTGVDVQDAMVATQKADMAFEMALAVRNKAVQAYQSVMGMQF